MGTLALPAPFLPEPRASASFRDNAGGDGTEGDVEKRVEALTALFHRKHEEAMRGKKKKSCPLLAATTAVDEELRAVTP